MDIKYIFGEIVSSLDKYCQSNGFSPNLVYPKMRDAYHIEILAQGTPGISHNLPIAIIDKGAEVIAIRRVDKNISLIDNELILQLLLFIEEFVKKINQPGVGEKLKVEKDLSAVDNHQHIENLNLNVNNYPTQTLKTLEKVSELSIKK